MGTVYSVSTSRTGRAFWITIITLYLAPTIGYAQLSETSEPHNPRRTEGILAATCFGAGAALLVTGAVLESKETQVVGYWDNGGNLTPIEVTTGTDTEKLMYLGAAIAFIGTMFLVFPSNNDSSDSSMAEANPGEEGGLAPEVTVLESGDPCVGLSLGF